MLRNPILLGLLMAAVGLGAPKKQVHYQVCAGYKAEDVKWEDFRSALLKDFIPAEFKVPLAKRVITFLNKDEKRKNNSPDFASLLVAGGKIEESAKLSGTLFGNLKNGGKATSRRVAVGPYGGTLDSLWVEKQFKEAALDVLGTRPDWSKGYLLIHLHRWKKKIDKPTLTNFNSEYLALLKELRKSIGLKGLVILVTEQYVLEFQLWKKEDGWLSSGPFIVDTLKEMVTSGEPVVVKPNPANYDGTHYDRLEWGQGAALSSLKH